MREKLLSLMKNENLTPSKLAELLGIQPSGIWMTHNVSALGNLPHSRGSKQTEFRSRSENPKAVPANKSRLAVSRPKTDVPPNLGERHLAERSTDC